MVTIIPSDKIGCILSTGEYLINNIEFSNSIKNSVSKSKARIIGSLCIDKKVKEGVYDLSKCFLTVKKITDRFAIVCIDGKPLCDCCTWWGYYGHSSTEVEATFVIGGKVVKKEVVSDKSLNHFLPQEALDRIALCEKAIDWYNGQTLPRRIEQSSKSELYIGYGKSPSNSWETEGYPTENIPYWKYDKKTILTETRRSFDFDSQTGSEETIVKEYNSTFDDCYQNANHPKFLLRGQVEYSDEILNTFETCVREERNFVASWLEGEGSRWDNVDAFETKMVDVILLQEEVKRTFHDPKNTTVITISR